MGLRGNFKQAARELIDGPRPPQSQGYQPAPEPPPVYSREPEARPEYIPPDFTDYVPEEPQQFTTVIAPGTIIRGTVESEGNVEVYGEVQGDITTAQDLTLKGKVLGNATGGNVEASGLQMVGIVNDINFCAFPPTARAGKRGKTIRQVQKLLSLTIISSPPELRR